MSVFSKLLIKKYVEQMAAGDRNAAAVTKFILVKAYGIEVFNQSLREVV